MKQSAHRLQKVNSVSISTESLPLQIYWCFCCSSLRVTEWSAMYCRHALA